MMAKLLSDREIIILAGQLEAVAMHLASRAGGESGAPPGPILRAERIELAAQWDSVTIAGRFVRNTLTRWLWVDALFDAQLAIYELTKAFVSVVQAADAIEPTRMTVRVRAVSTSRLVLEVHDSPDNAEILSAADNLISERIRRTAIRCGLHRTNGRTTAWCELARPEFNRWI
ncbi:hypothetical protein [Nocardia miyunensis]|uniref:hypothetical protein n=1 Tax=Nocardia miyunensis TaxID=282684 RepID=UPI000836D14F|nr:hypothetical protein [Nocardia miyunensis]